MSSSNAKNLIWFLVPQVVAILVLTLTVRLSLWQLDRADEKAELLVQWNNSELVLLGENDVDTLPDLTAIRAVGEFDRYRHVLLDNQTRNNHPGVHVYSLFTPANGAPPVLVNRGWQPWLRTSGEWPVFDTPEGMLEIQGRLNPPPRPGLMLGVALPLDPEQWPNLMTYLDLEQIRPVLGDDLADRVVLLEPDHAAHLSGDEWPRVNMTPERHRGYAFQWAAITAAILILWIGLTVRYLSKRISSRKKNPS
ncbi:MAG: SURF1 family protein [Pseudomonadota bacterium]